MQIVYLVLLNGQPNDTVQRLEIRENKTEIVALALLDKHKHREQPAYPAERGNVIGQLNMFFQTIGLIRGQNHENCHNYFLDESQQ